MNTASHPAPPRRAWVKQIMGLPVSIHLRGPDLHSTRVQRRVDAVFEELRVMDALFSTYRTDSETSRLNRGELAAAAADPVVREVIELCTEAHRRTNGAFDARWLPLPTGGYGFDPSGVVKGWAVQRAARHLRDLAGYDAHLNAGGDVLAHAAPHGQPWRIGVEDPAATGQLLDILELTAGAVATSGSAARGPHILDPRTGKPADQLLSATVTGPELLWADVYATAAVVHGPAAFDWLDMLPGYDALLVDAAGRTRATSGWPGRVPRRPAG